MLKSAKITLTTLIASTLILCQCKKDFDVNDNWKDIPIIYCLLNSQDSIHYIRVSKAYLGDGNSYAMAQISDSLYYLNATVKIEERINGNLTNTFNCVKIDTVREPGIFTQNNILFTSNAILSTNPNAKYKLIVFANNKVTTAETTLIQDFNSVISGGNTIYLSSNYSKLNMVWTTPPLGKIFEPVIRFFYYDITSTDTIKNYIDIVFDTKISNSKIGGETMNLELVGTSFLYLVSTLIPNNSQVLKRIVAKGSIETRISVGSDDFYEYIQATQPSSEIATDNPSFSNISNGFGLFSTRYLKISPSIKPTLSEQTIDSLALGIFNGPNGKNLKFAKYFPETFIAWTNNQFP